MTLITIETEKLNQEQVARLLGVTTKSIENYTKLEIDPIPFSLTEKKIGKSYKWSDVLAWWIKRKVGQGPVARFKPEDELTAAKLAGQNLKNELDQIEVEVRKGNLLDVNDVRNTWSNALSNIKQSLLNVGHTAAIEIIDGMPYAKKKSVIDTLLFQNLTEVIEAVETQDTTESIPNENG